MENRFDDHIGEHRKLSCSKLCQGDVAVSRCRVAQADSAIDFLQAVTNASQGGFVIGQDQFGDVVVVFVVFQWRRLFAKGNSAGVVHQMTLAATIAAEFVRTLKAGRAAAQAMFDHWLRPVRKAAVSTSR